MPSSLPFYGSGNYIATNGLVLNLDALYQASYPGAGTTWTNLTGTGNNGTLTNGPTFSSSNGGSLVLDGVNDYVATSYAPQFNDFSVIAWFKCTNIVAYSRLVDKAYNTGMWIGRNASNANSWGGGVLDSGAPYGRFITLQDSNWHMIASIRQGTTHTIYGDGITTSVSGTVSSTALSATNFSFGANQSTTLNADWFGGNIASVSVYNRALSATEVLQNYYAVRGRFGI